MFNIVNGHGLDVSRSIQSSNFKVTPTKSVTQRRKVKSYKGSKKSFEFCDNSTGKFYRTQKTNEIVKGTSLSQHCYFCQNKAELLICPSLIFTLCGLEYQKWSRSLFTFTFEIIKCTFFPTPLQCLFLQALYTVKSTAAQCWVLACKSRKGPENDLDLDWAQLAKSLKLLRYIR